MAHIDEVIEANNLYKRKNKKKKITYLFTMLGIGVICLMLFLTICALSSSLSLRNSLNKNIAKFMPADIQVAAYQEEGMSGNILDRYKKNKNDAKLITDGNEEKKEEAYDAMEDTNKMMSWMMPIMSVSIAYIAPLGLALYWFMNNILMIVERFVFDIVLKDDDEKEEAEKNG